MRTKVRRNVLITQAMIKFYRLPVFLALQRELAAQSIDLCVVYSNPPLREQARRDNVDLPTDLGVKTGRWWLGDRVLWQPCFRQIWDADLIIVEHAFKYVLNPFFLLLCLLRLKKLGVWVHGGELRYGKPGFGQKLRKWSAVLPNWRFAYTEGVEAALVANGAHSGTITVLQNAVDLTEFRTALNDVSDRRLADLRASLGMAEATHVALFCGSIYAAKGIDFAIEACDLVKKVHSEFHLIIVGSGSDASRVVHAAATRPWLHYLGPIHGEARAPYFRLAQVALMPYLTGLGILDAMSAGLPYLVTGAKVTNPEIDYLIRDKTGLVTGDDVRLYAQSLASLLGDATRLKAMSEAAELASRSYSVETMAANFCDGIQRALAGSNFLD